MKTKLIQEYYDVKTERAERFARFIEREVEPLVREACRRREVAAYRHALAWAIVSRLGLSTISAGAIMNRDHSTIIHSIHKVTDAIDYQQFDRFLHSAYKKMVELLSAFEAREREKL